MTEPLEIVLLLALPASGKSEVRRYLSHLSPDQCRTDFHLGPTVQLDDFPYVHLMRRIDDELAALAQPRAFFVAPDRSFQDPRDWGTLIQLLNEDHADLAAQRRYNPPSAGEDLMNRLEAAGAKVGIGARLAKLDAATHAAVAQKIEREARALLDEKIAHYTALAGKTLVIEFARGGRQGSTLPFEGPFGYRYSLAQLSSAILEHASILYIWVTAAESRRKNAARADPDDPGSILHHGVPQEVMMNDYGLDDMDWLELHARKPGTVTVETGTKVFHLPIARFDNRVDKTSFIREDPKDWKAGEVQAVHAGLKGALDRLAAARR
ncbi:MAG: hypothetical protein IT384_16170 [Deltaproteobacteria bacterium]|nr:hypothetical protein [Deltaproteobacteria bacterium]